LDSTFLLIGGSAVVIAFYVAWSIGANDVANSMGTSVGSRAISLKQAILIAGIFEFTGAVLIGIHVTKTIQNGIIDSVLFSADPNIYVYGMLGYNSSSFCSNSSSNFYNTKRIVLDLLLFIFIY